MRSISSNRTFPLFNQLNFEGHSVYSSQKPTEPISPLVLASNKSDIKAMEIMNSINPHLAGSDGNSSNALVIYQPQNNKNFNFETLTPSAYESSQANQIQVQIVNPKPSMWAQLEYFATKIYHTLKEGYLSGTSKPIRQNHDVKLLTAGDQIGSFDNATNLPFYMTQDPHASLPLNSQKFITDGTDIHGLTITSTEFTQRRLLNETETYKPKLRSLNNSQR